MARFPKLIKKKPTAKKRNGQSSNDDSLKFLSQNLLRAKPWLKIMIAPMPVKIYPIADGLKLNLSCI